MFERSLHLCRLFELGGGGGCAKLETSDMILGPIDELLTLCELGDPGLERGQDAGRSPRRLDGCLIDASSPGIQIGQPLFEIGHRARGAVTEPRHLFLDSVHLRLELGESTFKRLGCVGGPVFEFRYLPIHVFDSLTVSGKMNDARFERR